MCVFAHALVGIHPHGAAGGGKPERAARLHPQRQQIARESLAQPVFRGLGEPALTHVQHEQRADDRKPHTELIKKVVEIAPRQRIVERLVPAVEHDLAVGRYQDHHDQHAHQDHDAFADWRAEDGAKDHAHLAVRANSCGLIDLRGDAARVLLCRHRAACRAVTQEMKAA